MKIVFCGGGTMGPVTPLLAVYDKLKKEESLVEAIWIGTRLGVEEGVVVEKGLVFKPIFCGKFRRYFSWRNFSDLFLIFIGFWQSLFILLKFRPDIIIGAGGYVSVPCILAGFFLGIPALSHQQDVTGSLTNKLIVPFIKKLTVTYQESLKHFGKKAVWTGQPVRSDLAAVNPDDAYNFFGFKKELPVLLITGGGTGALSLNKLLMSILNDLLSFCQVIHLTGQGKQVTRLSVGKEREKNYRSYPFLNKEMPSALKIADLIITRAGAATTSEIIYLQKPAIIIPLPGTHQEANAKVFANKEAALVLNQENLTAAELLKHIKDILNNKEKQAFFSLNLLRLYQPKADDNIIKQIRKIIYHI